MRKVNRSALVPWSAGQMYALVADIAAYPDFLPWCGAAEIHSESAELVEASLTLKKGSVSKQFRTRNSLEVDQRMRLELVDGPFKHLKGCWTFHQLSDAGCKVQLDLEFEFESAVLDTLFGGYLEEACNRMINAFTERAGELCGESD